MNDFSQFLKFIIFFLNYPKQWKLAKRAKMRKLSLREHILFPNCMEYSIGHILRKIRETIRMDLGTEDL